MAMNQKDEILKLVYENNGKIQTKLVVEQNLRKEALQELVFEGKLVRVCRGLYMLPETSVDEYEVCQLKIPKGIFSYDSALYLHKLSNRVPQLLHMTISYDYKVTGVREKNSNVVFHYVSPDILALGKTTVNTAFGSQVISYDPERTILDIIKDKDKMDSQTFTDALKFYFEGNNKNLLKLAKYAKAMGLSQNLAVYSEVLL